MHFDSDTDEFSAPVPGFPQRVRGPVVRALRARIAATSWPAP